MMDRLADRYRPSISAGRLHGVCNSSQPASASMATETNSARWSTWENENESRCHHELEPSACHGPPCLMVRSRRTGVCFHRLLSAGLDIRTVSFGMCVVIASGTAL
jgi:hypothetical protein